MDVKSLYPSIPKIDGLEACKEALDNRTDKSIATTAVMKMLETVLDNNIFQFNNDNYIQVDGTAIWSRLGRNYACTYMGHWEKILLDKCKSKPLLYVRYVDDIFGLWTESQEELNEFWKAANNIHPRIQVDLRTSTSKLEFLDVLVNLNCGKIETTIFTKPSDKHMYLHSTSNHPKTTKKAIPYGLGIRARRICSTEEEFRSHKKKILDNLVNRGYQKKETMKILNNINKFERTSLLEYKNNDSNEDRIPLTLTFNNTLPNIQKIVHNRLNVLHRSDKMKSIFPMAPIAAFRRDANLEDILVHSKHNKMFEKDRVSKCIKKCAICKFITDETIHQVKDVRFVFNDKICCKSTNVVYGIQCDKCAKIVYVGETGTTIYERFQNHVSSIKRGIDHPVSDHFNLSNHSIDHLRIVCVEKITKNDIHYRKIRESFWINKLGTMFPNGINRNIGIGDGIRGSSLD